MRLIIASLSCLMFVVVLCFNAGAHAQCPDGVDEVFVSFQDGEFCNPSTWMGGDTVPGMFAEVIINHDVWAEAPVVVGSLTVNGSLITEGMIIRGPMFIADGAWVDCDGRADVMDVTVEGTMIAPAIWDLGPLTVTASGTVTTMAVISPDITIAGELNVGLVTVGGAQPPAASSLLVTSTGQILGFDGPQPWRSPFSYGTFVLIAADPFAPSVTMTNLGLIRGGRGGVGGPVVIQGGGPPLNNTCDIVNEGTINGGNSWASSAGPASVIATTGTNQNGGLIKGGDSVQEGHFAGPAELASRPWGTVTNTQQSEIVGGYSNPGDGGYAGMFGWTANNMGLIQGGNGAYPYEGGDAVLSGDNVTNTGVLEPGDPDGEVVLDPMDVTITGDTTLSGEIITLVAGDSMTIGTLNNEPAIEADETITIIVAPGGTLDLTNNEAGNDWLYAGTSITLKADTILTDSGVELADIMDPDPVILPGDTFTTYCVAPPTFITAIQPAMEFTIDVLIQNCGNVSRDAQIDIHDTAGWVQTSTSELVTLDAQESFEGNFEIHVPADAEEGDQTVVTLTVDDGLVQRTETYTFIVPIPPCIGDLTYDGNVNIDDIFAVLGLWGDCDDPCPPYCIGDITEDCTVNIDDIFSILGHWGPCP